MLQVRLSVLILVEARQPLSEQGARQSRRLGYVHTG